MIIHYALKGIVVVPAHVWITSPEYIVRSGITSPQLFFHIPARGVINGIYLSNVVFPVYLYGISSILMVFPV